MQALAALCWAYLVLPCLEKRESGLVSQGKGIRAEMRRPADLQKAAQIVQEL